MIRTLDCGKLWRLAYNTARDGIETSSAMIALSLAKMLSGANAFEISDIEEEETEARKPGDQNVTMLHCAENHRMEFSVGTGPLFDEWEMEEYAHVLAHCSRFPLEIIRHEPD